MYDLVSLSNAASYDMIKAKTADEYFLVNQGSTLHDFDNMPFYLDRIRAGSPYSKELTDLIERCMQVDWTRRPTSEVVQEESMRCLITNGLDRTSSDERCVRHHGLYYRGTEINNMPSTACNCKLPFLALDYSRLTGPGARDPDDPPLEN